MPLVSGRAYSIDVDEARFVMMPNLVKNNMAETALPNSILQFDAPQVVGSVCMFCFLFSGNVGIVIGILVVFL